MAGHPSERREDTFSWARPTTPAQAAQQSAADRRRERRRRWVRPHSVLVVLAVGAVDGLALLIVGMVLTVWRQSAGRPCTTFWADLAHDTTTAIWCAVVVLVVTTLASMRWRWVFVATLVVQLVVAGVVLPSQFHHRAEFTAVAEGRLSPAEAGNVQVACDSSG